MTHRKLLSNSNSTITVIQSGCHRTYKISWNFMIRWAHDGITRASRSRIAFLRQSITFLFPSYCFHDVKKKVSLEVKTKITRFYKMPSRWHYEGQNGYTNSTRKWTFAKSSGNFLACHFATAHEVPAWPWETPHVVKRWLKMPSRMTRCVYDQSRLWTFPFSCIHLVSTSGQCDACIKKIFQNQYVNCDLLWSNV